MAGAMPYGYFWSQTGLRAVAPSDAYRVEIPLEAVPENRMQQITRAFLGLCIDVDIVPDGQSSLLQPEQIAFLLVGESLELIRDARSRPKSRDLLQPRPFANLVAAALGFREQQAR